MRAPDDPRSSTRPLRRFGAIALAALCIAGAALAQSPFGNTAPSGVRQTPMQASPARPAAPAPQDARLLARVEGRPITQAAFDRIAAPYLARLRAQLGGAFTDDIMKVARKSAFDELVRHEVLAIEAERQKVAVTEADTDSLLAADPMLQTNGRFDAGKLREFKLNLQSNYLQLLPRLQEFAAVAKLDRQIHERFTPSRAAVRAEFDKRTAQVRFSFLALQLRDISLEPESTEPEWRAYYNSHTGELQKKAQVRMRYYRLPLPATTDSARAAAEARALERGHRMADSLRAGTLADSSADAQDTGLFDADAAFIPGLGRPPELAAAIARAESALTVGPLGAFVVPNEVIVPSLVERHAKRPLTFLEALGSVKRSADAEKRKATAEADRRAWFTAHREQYRGTRATVSRLTLKPGAFKGRDIPSAELDRWYQVHGHTLFGLPDSSRGWLPPASDSLRRIVRQRMAAAERDAWLQGTLDKLGAGLRTAHDFAALTTLARANTAAAETLSFTGGMATDSLFTGAAVDSMLARGPAGRGLVQGPLSFNGTWVVWRVDAIDTAYAWPFETARPRVEAEFTADKERKDEADGRARYEAHRPDYVTPLKYAIEFATVSIPPADSVRLSAADLQAEYRRNLARYHHEEEVSARHILLSTRSGGPDADVKMKARADSLLTAIHGGADFAELAKRFSQDPGSGAAGGDLGWFGRGRMVPEFERAAFALKPGEVSGVVKTAFGYHILKLDDRRPAGTKPFSEVSADLRAVLAASRADTSARKSAESLRRRLAGGADAKTAAAPHGGIRSSGSFGVNEAVPGLGMVQGLANDIAKLPPGRWAPTVYRSGGSYVVLRVAHVVPSRPADWDEARVNAIQDALAAKRKELLMRKAAAIRAALASGARLDSLAAPYGGLKDSGPVPAGSLFVAGLGVEPRLIDRAFATRLGEVSDTLEIAQGVAWVRPAEHTSGDAKMFESQQAQITQDLLNKGYVPWLEERKRTLRIEILDPEFRSARPTPARGSVLGGG